MSNNLLKNSELINKIKEFQRKNIKEILDIVLFGSVTRGKKKPVDIDVLLIFKDQENSELSHQLTKIFEGYDLKPEVTNITYQGVFNVKFLPRESILSEGYSIITNQTLSESFGFRTYTMFIYSQKGFSQTKRMKFHYALNGRSKNPGILKEMSAIKLTDTTVLVPLKKSEEFKNFLNLWEISFRSFDVLIPQKTIEYDEFRL